MRRRRRAIGGALQLLEKGVEVTNIVNERCPDLHWRQLTPQLIPAAPTDAEVPHGVLRAQA